MGNRLCVAVAVLAFTFIALRVASASITGSISGVVTDSTGAVISGASVAAVDTQTGVRTTVTTEAKGFYSLPTLAIGTYALEIRHIGFKTFQKNGLIIDANSTLRADAILDVGAINEKVEVSTDTNPRDGNPYFNTSLFSNEQLGQFGDSRRRFFHGPGLNNFDMALAKSTKFTESKELQPRLEAFNLFNHAQFETPTGEINSSQFGLVTSARPGRILQLGAKFLF
ncbi:MAG: carboxypeptidase-like regulatory domain-containing protein [Candidatus Sulfotelmatobacter sp.]